MSRLVEPHRKYQFPLERSVMSDNNSDIESSSGNSKWSEADKRLLLITFLGGLGANIGIALMVGLVLGLIRLNAKHGTSYRVLADVIFWAVGFSVAAIAVFFQRILLP